MSDSEKGIDPFSKIFLSMSERERDKLEKLKDSNEKLNFILSEYSKSLQKYFIQISKMSERDFNRLMKNRTERVMGVFGQLSVGIIKDLVTLEKIPIEDIGMLTSASQLHISNDFMGGLDPKTEKVLENNSTLIRLLSLEIMNRYEQNMNEQLLEITLKPLTRITEMLHRRFGADFNWALAASLLSIHENLVKKKLSDLDVNEKEITQIERERKFAGLIERLRQKMEENKENIGMLFYKSSTLRDIRNKMEHHGYKQKVTNNEVLELLDDLEKFETSIFK